MDPETVKLVIVAAFRAAEPLTTTEFKVAWDDVTMVVAMSPPRSVRAPAESKVADTAELV